MSHVFITAEKSKEPGEPFNPEYFFSLEELLGYVEAIDVIDDEFCVFCSDGRIVHLSAEGYSSKVVARIEETATAIDVVRKLIFNDLVELSNRKKYDIDMETVKAATTVEELVHLIPKNAIRGAYPTGIFNSIISVFKKS